MKKLSFVLVLLIPIFLSCKKKDTSPSVEDADKFIGSYSWTILGQTNTFNVTKISSNKINIEFPGSVLGFLKADVSGRNLTIEPRTVYINGVGDVTYSGTGNISEDGKTLTLSTNHFTAVGTRI